ENLPLRRPVDTSRFEVVFRDRGQAGGVDHHTETGPRPHGSHDEAEERVSGLAIQFTASDLIPSRSNKAGTSPIGASRMNRRTTPITMRGVTIPRKTRDLTMEAPRTFWRRTARNKPMNRGRGRWMPVQTRLLSRVPHGGPLWLQAGSQYWSPANVYHPHSPIVSGDPMTDL